MLRDNSVQIQQQAASATIGLPQLQAAFANIYQTMDAIDTFKVQALDTMAADRRRPADRGREVAGVPGARPEARRAHAPAGSLDLGRLSGSGRCPSSRTCSAPSTGRRPTPARAAARAPARADERRPARADRRDRGRRRRPRRRGPAAASWSRVTGPQGLRDRPRRRARARPARRRQPRRPLRRWPRPRATCPRRSAATCGCPAPTPTARPVDGGKTSLMVLVDQLDLLGRHHGQDPRRRLPRRRRGAGRARAVPRREVRRTRPSTGSTRRVRAPPP